MEVKEVDLGDKEKSEFEIQKNIENYIVDNLNDRMLDGKQEYLIYDTLVEKVANYHQITEKNAHTIIQKIMRECVDVWGEKKLMFDGTVIKPK